MTRNEILKMAQTNPNGFIKHHGFQTDRTIAMEVLSVFAETLCVANKQFQDDKELVLIAVKKYGGALEFVSKRLQNDIEVVQTAISDCPRALHYASEKIKNNKKIVIETVKKDNWAIQYASNRLKNNSEMLIYMDFYNPNKSIPLKVLGEKLRKQCAMYKDKHHLPYELNHVYSKSALLQMVDEIKNKTEARKQKNKLKKSLKNIQPNYIKDIL